MKKHFIWVVIVVILVLVAISSFDSADTPSSSGGDNTSSDEQVKIGGLFGLTGFVAFAGEVSQNGFIMAIEDSGMDVEYVIEDFQSDLAQTVSAATKLLTIDDVDIVIGPEWAEFGEVAVPLADENKVPFFSPWLTSEGEWLKSSDYYFSGTASERWQVREVFDHMVDNGVERLAIIHSQNAWAFGLLDIIQDELATNYQSIEVVFESQESQEETDYRTTLTKLQEANPDAVYSIMAAGITAEAFVNQSKELQVDAGIYMPFSAVSQLLSIEDANVEGILYPASVAFDRNDEFNAKYTKRFGVEPAAISGATAYDMTTLVLNTIKDGATTGSEIRDALAQTRDYVGYSNIITFNENGQQAFEETELRQVVGDSFVVVSD